MQYIQLDKKRLYPSKVVCVGRNYAAHIAELNNEVPSETVIFVKPNSAISERLCMHNIDEIHYEAELSFVVENDELIAVGLGLDLTKRVIQNGLKNKGLPWERAKAFDHSAVFSKFISIRGLDIDKLSLNLYINDELKQSGGVDLMLNKPQALLSEIASFMSFENGDILMTGTPSGVGIVNANAQFKGQVCYANQVLIEATWLSHYPTPTN